MKMCVPISWGSGNGKTQFIQSIYRNPKKQVLITSPITLSPYLTLSEVYPDPQMADASSAHGIGIA
jgi:hypothetical protein